MDKVAIITGSSKGLGRVIAGKLAEQGWKLGLCARSPISIYGVDAKNSIIGHFDISIPSNVRPFVYKVNWKFGHIDLLINNAGFCHPLKDIQDITSQEAKEALLTNVLGPFYFMQAVIPLMIQQKSGLIINIGSRAAINPNTKLLMYSASKGGLNTLSDGVSKYLTPYGIKCVTINPGPMDTDMRQIVVGDASKQESPIRIADEILKEIRGM
jgi:NAD(P)-dependent dehydrogenase (short-subunit alcohol dehydrogenase family)